MPNPQALPPTDAPPPPAEDPAAAPRVLVIEDDPLLLRSIVRTLRASGALVTQASDGQLAEQMLRVRRFDLVLTDLSLPDVSGIEIVARARALDGDVSVVFMTGTPTDDTAARAVELGALRYLVKPVEPQLLLRAVSDATLCSRQRRAQPKAQGSADAASSALDERFERALAGLWMAYQPIFRKDGTRYGYEALLRSSEASLGNPLALLDAADRLQRVHDLGRVIRANVARTVAASPVGAQVFVNLYPLDLLDDELYAPTSPLTAHAARVVLEITERNSLDAVPDAHSRIRALRKLGFRCAVDDLGAGYAGLATLAQQTPEVIKIDMSLMRDVDRDPVKQKLVMMVSAVAHELSALVVGEGIETEGERAAAITLGCDLVQGYLLGRPERLDVLAP
jgi:EAL domain-containing protein (putative c-di-GMP-specific phosphodiesterase class I)